MRRLLFSMAALAAFLAVAAVSPFTAADANAAPAAKASRPGIVVLFRGGGNIFSTGMNEIADKLVAQRVNARSVGHASWQQIADEAREAYRKRRQPIIFVGHSFGANAAMLAARELGKSNVPVSLVVLYDPTAVLQVPANVRHVINNYSKTFDGIGLEVKPAAQFRGKLENVGHSHLGHLTIDNDDALQDQMVREIVRIIRRGR